MGVFWRWISRVSFFVIAAAISFSVIRYPQTSGATLHTLGEIPLNRAATETVRPLTRPIASLAASPAEAPGEEPAPAVEGDILGLMYHDLTDDPEKGTAWTTTSEKVREDITTLLGAGYRPLSVEDYLDGAYRRGQDYFIVTFDDGYLSNLTMAFPILTEMGVPATVFVITGSEPLDNHMSWDELRTFESSALASVYSHTDTHANAQLMPLSSFLLDEDRRGRSSRRTSRPSEKFSLIRAALIRKSRWRRSPRTGTNCSSFRRSRGGIRKRTKTGSACSSDRTYLLMQIY